MAVSSGIVAHSTTPTATAIDSKQNSVSGVPGGKDSSEDVELMSSDSSSSSSSDE